MTPSKKNSSWRDFQAGYLLKKQKKLYIANGFKFFIPFLICSTLVIGGIVFHPFSGKKRPVPTPSGTPLNKKGAGTAEPQIRNRLPQPELQALLSQTSFFKTDKNIFFIDTPEDSFRITTGIDINLQAYLLTLLARSKRLTRGKPQRIAFVIMEPDTGKILGMAGFDLDDPKINPCLQSDFPAASVFKIITASAAVQELGYTPATPLYFNGNKYTLYKRQLRDVKNKYTYKITFSKAFAESINPVFGKIGKNYLGKEKLSRYADAFGFNRTVRRELTFESGAFSNTGSDYYQAELGCGFNTDTTISPVFGAMLAGAAINKGLMALPTLVEHVTDSSGEIVYKSQKASYIKAIAPETARTLVQLMAKTITGGTARKSFRNVSRDATLSGLLIGGKTGSIYNREHTVKYDWFTGFAQEKKTGKKVAVSIVVGHRKYIGTRATTYARNILKQYFKTRHQTAAL